MPEPLPVTDDDVLHAWRVYYARRDPHENIQVVDPRPNDWGDDLILACFRNVLEADRQRVAERAR